MRAPGPEKSTGASSIAPGRAAKFHLQRMGWQVHDRKSYPGSSGLGAEQETSLPRKKGLT